MKECCVYLLLLSLLVGCAGIDSSLSTRGVLESTTSKMDGTRIVSMSPVLAKSGLTDIQAEFGLYWDDTKGDNAFLIVEIDGTKSFDPQSPFEIKVDDELFKLPPANTLDYGDTETYYGSQYIRAHNKSRKSYVIHKKQIQKIANGKVGAYRIWFLKNRFAEGEVSYQYPEFQSYVPYSFNKFYAQVWK